MRLGLRTIYIVPTRFGWLWLAGALVLLVVGIQTQTNGPLLVCFLMVGLFLLTLLLTHANLQGLVLLSGRPAPGFAGESVPYPVRVRCPRRCEGLRLALGGRASASGPAVSLAPGEHHLTVVWTPARRGEQSPGLLRLHTRAPLGLFHCWAHWRPESAQLIWPARRAGPVQERERTNGNAAGHHGAAAVEGGEDWRDLSPHRPEDGAVRLAWKLLAAGRGRHAKRFGTSVTTAALLAPAAGVPFEEGLEHLSERICRLHRRGLAFGLRIGRQSIPPGRGLHHRDRCLAALARAR